MIRIYGRKVRAKGDDLHATTSLLCVAQHVKRYVRMVYMVGSLWKSIFICNKQSIFSTSKQGVTANLVEAAEAVLWLRENCTSLSEFSTKMTFHTN